MFNLIKYYFCLPFLLNKTNTDTKVYNFDCPVLQFCLVIPASSINGRGEDYYDISSNRRPNVTRPSKGYTMATAAEIFKLQLSFLFILNFLPLAKNRYASFIVR